MAQVSARIASLIVQRLEAAGHSAAALLQHAGLDREQLTDPDARIALAAEEALWDAAATIAQDPLFGLHAARAIRPGQFDVVDYLVRTAPTLREALVRLARYNRLLHDVAAFELQEVPGALRVVHGLPGRPASPHAAEFTLASLVVVGRQLLPALSARQVEFAHAARGSDADYVQVFGVMPRFRAAATSISFPLEAIEAPLPSADPTLARIVAAHADQVLARTGPAPQAGVEQVRQAIAGQLSAGSLSLASVAQQLHTSERSLQRRLEAQGLRFSELVDGVRKDLALRYVADRRLALGEVAYLLGFSEPSPFHRAFKRWTGMTPAAARRARA